jgi:K+ transporter
MAAFEIDKDSTLFVYGNPVIVGKSNGGLPGWERRLFDVMQRLSRSVAAELQIKANRRVELGIEVAV